MGQKRYYQLLKTENDKSVYSFVACHSPKDFLGDYLLGENERPKAGRVYIKRGEQYAQNAPTIQYTPITRDYYESCLQTLNSASEDVQETPASEFTDGLTYSADEMEAEPNGADFIGVTDEEMEFQSRKLFPARLRCGEKGFSVVWNEGNSFDRSARWFDTAEKAREWAKDNGFTFDETPNRKGVIRYCPWNGPLKFEAEDTENETSWYFQTKQEAIDQLNNIGITEYTEEKVAEYEQSLKELDEAIAYTDEQVTKVEARVSSPNAYAQFKAPALSDRQKRRNPGSVFGLQRKFNAARFTQ